MTKVRSKPESDWNRKLVRRLAGWMSRLDVSQNELAKRLRDAGVAVSQRAISSILSGATKHPRKPTIDQVVRAMRPEWSKAGLRSSDLVDLDAGGGSLLPVVAAARGVSSESARKVNQLVAAGGAPTDDDYRQMRPLALDVPIDGIAAPTLAVAVALYVACRRTLQDESVSFLARAKAMDFAQGIADAYARRSYIGKSVSDEDWCDAMKQAHADLRSIETAWLKAQEGIA